MPVPLVIGNASRWIGERPLDDPGIAEKADISFYSAILEQAIIDKDRYWFTGEIESLVTFVDCCEVLGLDPSAARKAILASLPKPYPWRRHVYDNRPVKEERDYEWTHAHATCHNGRCAECEFRRLLRQRKVELRESASNYIRVTNKGRQLRKGHL